MSKLNYLDCTKCKNRWCEDIKEEESLVESTPIKKSKNCNNCGDINCAAHGDGEQFSCKNWMEKDTDYIDWMHDDITWCRRTKCPNKECFRNQVNRRLKAGFISVADMYKEGECPKEAE